MILKEASPLVRSTVYRLPSLCSAYACACLFLTPIQGIAMANRRFDTYMPGASEQLEDFLESIMSGRYIFFVIKVTVAMTPHCHDCL